MKVFSFIATLIMFFSYSGFTQVTGSFQVKGLVGTYYPVTFSDGGYINNAATELELGRSDVHADGSWRGSFTAKFRYHTNNSGNANTGAFIESDIQTNDVWTILVINCFVGGYQDATDNNSDKKIVIWLRGGTTTYYYKANYGVTPTVYDNVQNTLPYTATGGPSFNSKATADPNINQNGITNNAFYNSNTSIYTNRVVVGATTGPVTTSYKLDVYGTARANKVVVNTSGADFVFDSSYKLRSLDTVSNYIEQNKHLPDISPAADMQKNGVDLGDNQTKLLQKIEELTLYLIQQNKQLQKQNMQIQELQDEINTVKKKQR